MRESGETLVQRLGITKGLKVLDLGCGDGTTAMPAAKLGADVLGIDIARNLVEAGNRRATEQGLTNLKFQEGDASNLEQVPDKSFDLVVSIFGAMFAPKPFDVEQYVVVCAGWSVMGAGAEPGGQPAGAFQLLRNGSGTGRGRRDGVGSECCCRWERGSRVRQSPDRLRSGSVTRVLVPSCCRGHAPLPGPGATDRGRRGPRERSARRPCPDAASGDRPHDEEVPGRSRLEVTLRAIDCRVGLTRGSGAAL